MSTVSTSPRATEDSVTPRRHSLTEGQKPGWTWMAVAAAAAVVAAGLTVLLSGAFNVVGFVTSPPSSTSRGSTWPPA